MLHQLNLSAEHIVEKDAQSHRTSFLPGASMARDINLGQDIHTSFFSISANY
jgi:hypothetical protein